MYKYILEQAGDLDWMAIFALLVFFIVFVTSAILVLGKSKSHIDKMAHLPLENDSVNYETQDPHEK